MRTIAFYRQKRFDEAVRTGIEINDAPAWESYEEGPDDHDPGLLWYVDLVFEGEALPTGVEESRRWLMEQSSFVREVLTDTASSIEVGFDVEPGPFRREFRMPSADVALTVSISAVHRLVAIEMAAVIKQIADDWDAFLQRLQPLACV